MLLIVVSHLLSQQFLLKGVWVWVSQETGSPKLHVLRSLVLKQSVLSMFCAADSVGHTGPVGSKFPNFPNKHTADVIQDFLGGGGGGFKYFLCSSLFVEDSHFD